MTAAAWIWPSWDRRQRIRLSRGRPLPPLATGRQARLLPATSSSVAAVPGKDVDGIWASGGGEVVASPPPPPSLLRVGAADPPAARPLHATATPEGGGDESRLYLYLCKLFPSLSQKKCVLLSYSHVLYSKGT